MIQHFNIRNILAFFSVIFTLQYSSFSYGNDAARYWLLPEQGTAVPPAYVEYVEYKDDLSLGDLLALGSEVNFQPMGDQAIDRGFTENFIWLKIPVENGFSSTQSWILDNSFIFGERYSVYLVKEGYSVKLADVVSGRELNNLPISHIGAAAEFSLQPEEKAFIYINYKSKTGTRLLLRMSNLPEVSALGIQNIILYSFLNGLLLTLIVINLLQFFSVRLKACIFYIVQLLSVILYFFVRQGYGYIYLWPNYEEFNSTALILVGILPSLTMLIFARVFLDTREKFKNLDRVIVAIILVYFCLLASTSASHFYHSLYVPTVIVVAIVAIVSPVLAITSGYMSYRSGYYPALYFLIAWVFLFFSILVHVVFELIFIEYAIYSTEILMLGYFIESPFIAAAIAQHIRLMRIDKEKTQEKLIYEMQARLNESKLLIDIENDKKQAEANAAFLEGQLKSASHDLFQPLYSIRMALESMRDEYRDMSAINHINDSVDYIENLLKDTMSSSHQAKVTIETICLNEIFNELYLRHRVAAEIKGLKFNVIKTSVAVPTAKIVLTRILENLVSNAIRYTQQGRICLGVKHHKNAIEIRICDTGPGISDEVLSNLTLEIDQQRSIGFGIGLYIVKTLSSELNYEFSIRNSAHYTCCSIYIPVSENLHITQLNYPKRKAKIRCAP